MVRGRKDDAAGGWLDGLRAARRQPILLLVVPVVLGAVVWGLLGGTAAVGSVVSAKHAADYKLTVTGTRSGACPIANFPPPGAASGPRYSQRDERCYLTFSLPGGSERKVRLAQPSWLNRGPGRVVAVIDGPRGHFAIRTDTGSPQSVATTALGLFLGSEGLLVLLSILLVRRLNRHS